MTDIEPVKRILVCWRVEALTHPNPESVEGVCSRCRRPIWVMARNVGLDMPKVCDLCVHVLMREGEEAIFLPAREAHGPEH